MRVSGDYKNTSIFAMYFCNPVSSDFSLETSMEYRGMIHRCLRNVYKNEHEKN
jgi:hypothetical protein